MVDAGAVVDAASTALASRPWGTFGQQGRREPFDIVAFDGPLWLYFAMIFSIFLRKGLRDVDGAGAVPTPGPTGVGVIDFFIGSLSPCSSLLLFRLQP